MPATTPTPPDGKVKSREEAERSNDLTIQLMLKCNIPITFEHWLNLNYPEGAPEGWELEMEIPEIFRDEFE